MTDVDFSPERRLVLTRMKRSGPVRIAVAIGAALLIAVTAWALWTGHDILLLLCLLLLGSYGLRAIGDALPVSAARRAKWDLLDQLDAQYPSHRNRGLLWLGIALLLVKLMGLNGAEPAGLVAPAFLIVVGGISSAVWHFRHAAQFRP
jgi:hypothetical protein